MCKRSFYLFYRGPCTFVLSISDIFPIATGRKSELATKDFLQNVLEILWDFVRESNDRDSKVLDFHHPEQLMGLMDFSLPEDPQNLQQILNDCRETLKHQVKTGKVTVLLIKCI
jgi:glutamate decarboxylase